MNYQTKLEMRRLQRQMGGLSYLYFYPLLDDYMGANAVEQLNDDLTKLAEELLVTREWLSEVLGQIKQSRQVIFYGPPGTGKTFIGKAIARHIAAKEDCELIQFHPSYSYEDFFEGFRPA